MPQRCPYPRPMPKRPKPLLARPSNKPIDMDALIDRILRRFPITMARLREAEVREAEEAEREARERGWDMALFAENNTAPRRRA